MWILHPWRTLMDWIYRRRHERLLLADSMRRQQTRLQISAISAQAMHDMAVVAAEAEPTFPRSSALAKPEVVVDAEAWEVDQ